MLLNLCNSVTLFNNENYLFSDFTFVLYSSIFITFVLAFFNSTRPLFLLICLELIYLFINMQFILSWLFINNIYGTTFVLIILCISAAESVVGVSIILKLYNTKNVLTLVNFNI